MGWKDVPGPIYSNLETQVEWRRTILTKLYEP